MTDQRTDRRTDPLIEFRGRILQVWSTTERDDLQDVEHLKRIATPPTAQTVRAIGLIFGLGILWRDISGATVAIFEFPS